MGLPMLKRRGDIMNLRSSLLAPLSWIYTFGIRWRNHAYLKNPARRTTLPGKVISVGNIEVGGTGKSPMVIAIAQFLQEQGYEPAILTRGYRSGLDETDSMAFFDEHELMAPQRAGRYHADEAKMQSILLKTVPVVIGADRVAAARRYLQNNEPPTHWILDDGFQHLQIQRDCDIVLLDAQHPWGENGRVLPAGRLREPVSHLRRAHVILFTRASKASPIAADTQRIDALKLPWFKVPFKEDHPVQVAGGTVLLETVIEVGLVAAIAKPQHLLHRAERMRLIVNGTLFKNDHETFAAQEIMASTAKAPVLLTTAKDYWRDPSVFHAQKKPVFILPIKPEISHDTMRQILNRVL